MIQITYIWHDCFVVELPEIIMIFDFWKDPTCDSKAFPDFIRNADKEKPLYVFISHHHKDHYSKKVFDWDTVFREVRYIVSEDVARHARHILTADSLYNGHKVEKNKITILKKGDSFKDSNIYVEAFGSTDIGNSYYIELCAKASKKRSFFHAGDLNAWLWADESTKEEIETSMSDFEKILSAISDAHPEIDYVMFPVDSRIGTGYATGAKLFVRAIDVRYFFPMHFGLGENEEERMKSARDASCLQLYANPNRGKYISLQAPYSCYREA